MEILFDLDRKAVTRKAKNNMVDIHSEKVLKAWLDKNELERKLREVASEIGAYSEKKIKDAEAFIKDRATNGGDPKEGMTDLVAKLIGKKALEDQMRQATLQYDFFVDVVMTLKQL